MCRPGKNRRPAAWLAAGALLLSSILPVTVTAAGSGDQWEYDATIYLWAAAIDATTPTGGDIDLSFHDILQDLDMTFMGMLGARKGKWSLLGDVIYMDLSDSQYGSGKLINLNVPTKVDVEMESWIVTVAGGYNLVDTGKYSLDVLGGARYITVDLPLKFQVGPIKLKTTPSGDYLDGIVGVRGKADLADKWYLSYYLDAGTGDSSSTWQALAGLNYQFEKFDAGFGYRYLTWNLDDNALDDLTVKGPYAGVRFLF